MYRHHKRIDCIGERAGSIAQDGTQTYVFMKHRSVALAKAVIHNGVRNGSDAQRKLLRHQMPLAEHKRNTSMIEFMPLKTKAYQSFIRQTTLDIDRITCHWVC